MNLIKRILLLLSILIPSALSAQFYVTGDDPGRLKWSYMDTESFRIIYPQGSDSLARVYGTQLEKYKVPVSRTTGYMVGQGDGKLMPAVMHTYNTANGSVAWAPRRMDLFTVPTAYDPEPLPWATMLSVHEGRHVTQMQFGMTQTQKGFTYAFGEMWNILVSILYPLMHYVEGDAVVAETALTQSGRGRTADFLNYYRVAFDQGDFRNWSRWRYGSQKYYTPNYYALGYMNLAGTRYLYDYPTIMKDGYNKSARNPLYIAPVKRLTVQRAGKKFKENFAEICDTMNAIWKRDADERAPFIPMEEVSKTPRHHTDYTNCLSVGEDLYTVKRGFLMNPTLIRIDAKGKERFVSRFAYETSELKYKDGRIFWTETISDPRWSMKADSRLMSINRKRGKKRYFTGRKEMLFSPSFSEDKIASAQYYPEGGSAVKIISETKEVSIPAPDSLQIVETAWIGDMIYCTAISDGGFGIYSLDPRAKVWGVTLEPQPVKIKDFQSIGEELMFTSDRTGVNELYHLSPASGELRQKTVLRYGGEDFTYSTDGKYLYYTSQTLKGKKIYRTPVDSLIDVKADFTDRYEYVLAEAIARQEKEIALEMGASKSVEDVKVTFTEPEKYGKMAHMFNIHSWTPVYVNVDNIMNMSFDYIHQAASLGATAIMQNRLATGVGEFGYSAHKDPYNREKWRHSGHFRYTYSGLYPIIETRLDVNDRAARQYSVQAVTAGEQTMVGISSAELDMPYIDGKISTYVPINLSSGGWKRGIIPQLNYRITNDMFNNAITVCTIPESGFGNYPFGSAFLGVTQGKNTFRHYLSGSLRGYITLPVTNSAVYPRWGIGTELGASASLESTRCFSPMGYAYVYGYLPGFWMDQGMKLTVWHQAALDKDSFFGMPVVNVMPRGLASGSSLTSWISIRNRSITKFTADYAIPLYVGDLAIGGGFFYVKRLVVTPHFDYSITSNRERLCSVGGSLVFDLNSLLWLGWPVSMGVTYSYNGLADFDAINEASGLDLKRNYCNFVFNVSF